MPKTEERNYNGYAEEATKLARLIEMGKHLLEKKEEVLPSNTAGDILVTVAFTKPELMSQLEEKKSELKDLKKKNRGRSMGGPFMIGPPDEREEKLIEEIERLEDEMDIVNVTLPMDAMFACKILDVVKESVAVDEQNTRQRLIQMSKHLKLD